jgi:ribonucleoside-diphosphate reductase alpha chain
MSNLSTNNSYYFAPVRNVNPCGEATLEDNGSCVLGSIVLPKFIVNGRVKWKDLEETVRLGIRFLDNVIDSNRFSLEQVKQASKNSRRIGLGVMGLADMLLDAEIRYGSIQAVDFTERLFKFIRNISYEESVKLAQERGSFPQFNSELYCKAKFIRTLPPTLRSDIRKYGTRNVTVSAIAPTGTISLIPEVSSSIEPIIYKAYERRDRVSTRRYIHPKLRAMLDSGEPTDNNWFVDSGDLEPKDHIDMQIAIQKYVDGAVSKTVNIPETFDKEEFSNLLLESIDDIKGVTAYRQDSRLDNPIVPIDLKTLSKDDVKRDNEADTVLPICSSGTCNID